MSGPATPEAVEPFEAPDEYDKELALDPALDVAFERALKRRRKVLTPASTEAHLTVVSNGTNRLGQPILMEPITHAAIMNNLLCREELDPSPDPLPETSATIIGLENYTNAVSKGEDITPFKENIERVAANQPEKGALFNSYLNQADKEVLSTYYILRERTLNRIKKASMRGDLTLAEAIVVWSKVNDEIPEIKRNIEKADKAVDYMGAVEKIDTNKQKVESEVRSRWEGTTPQGRELIRKKLWEIKREMELKAGVFPPGVALPEVEQPEDDSEPPPLPPITLAHPP